MATQRRPEARPNNLQKLWTIGLSALFSVLVVPALSFAAYFTHSYVVNSSGNTYTGSANYSQFISVGEPAVHETGDSQWSIKSGFIVQDAIPPTPAFTRTITLTPGPTATPTPSPTTSPYVSPTITLTPILDYADFQGDILDPKYFYVAPNPARGTNVNFKFFLKQSAEVEIRVYTPIGSHVLTKNFTYYPQGWNTCIWNASGMANGVYFYVVEAKVNGLTEKLKVKKIALVK